MTLIDEFTRECLAIRVARRINSLGTTFVTFRWFGRSIERSIRNSPRGARFGAIWSER
jgi:hypothetical protein